jgi:endonuclease-8
MPEGDSVWQAARRLRALDGQVLVASDFRVPQHATVDLTGRAVLTTVSRGKHLLTRFDDGHTLHTHLRMEGHWDLHPRGARWRRPAHTARVVLGTDAIEAVGFDVLVDLVPTDREHELVGHLGPDLLGPDWDAAEAVRRLTAAPEVPIAEALLDQRNLAGIGNVYKCELCFMAGVNPWTPVGEVPDAARLITLAHQMLNANRDRPVRVTTGDTRRGRTTWVYGRRGPCLRCHSPIAVEGPGASDRDRLTWWCPTCQPTRATGPAVGQA